MRSRLFCSLKLKGPRKPLHTKFVVVDVIFVLLNRMFSYLSFSYSFDLQHARTFVHFDVQFDLIFHVHNSILIIKSIIIRQMEENAKTERQCKGI